jgi:hypothetical protein
MKRSPWPRDPNRWHLHLKEIRRALRWGERAISELERIQESIPLPASENLERMISGEMPLSDEAYVLAILQHGVLNLEIGTLDVRVSLHIVNFREAEHRTQRRGRDFDPATGLRGAVEKRKAKVCAPRVRAPAPPVSSKDD